MPVLPRFPSVGGAAGYKYQSGCVGGVTYSMDAGGGLSLKWSDPADILLGDKAISEWKGTIVVCKEGSAPKSVDDGTIICDSTVRDQYKETGLAVGVGGPGYYYGVFPYTKDYVVNVDGANTVYVLSEGYDAALENASWSDIAYIAAQGKAAEIWRVGDEKEIQLSGIYNGAIHAQIAGFEHDDLAGGGKAGISFVSREIVTYAPHKPKANWLGSNIKTDIFPGIEGSLPATLQRSIKKICKDRRADCKSLKPSIMRVEEYLFCLSTDEAGLGTGYVVAEGGGYPLFTQGNDSRIKKDMNGNGSDGWWTCTMEGRGDTGALYWYFVGADGRRLSGSSTSDRGVVFGFCI